MDGTTNPLDDSRHPVDVLAEDFAMRIRSGETPSVEDYAQRYPEHAQVIREVFPPIEIVERLNSERETQRALGSAPKQLGDFRIVREIGRGGMGIVYEAIQQSLRRRVALKTINTANSEREKNRDRFRREAEAAAGLHHTNIVQVYGSGEDHGLLYYAMQLIDGVPLHDVFEWLQQAPAPESNTKDSHFSTQRAAISLLSKSFRLKSPGAIDFQTPPSLPTNSYHDGTLAERPALQDALTEPMETETPSPMSSDPHSPSMTPPERRTSETAATVSNATHPSLSPDYIRNVTRIIADVANALAYAHRQKVLHRDIKPANLILDRDGTIWVTDFGLARRTDLESGTVAGEVLGTLRYMAPEQISGTGDARSDIYSLGLCLFELLTLQPAFDTPKQRLLDPFRYSTIPSIRACHPRIPRDLETITRKACSLEPDHRYSSADALEEDLRRFLDDRNILARRATPMESLIRWARRNPAIAALATTSTAMLIAILGILAVWNRQQEDSLRKIGRLYDEAANNLVEKSAALVDAKEANSRAEANLELATQAFDSIIENISSRGAVQIGSEEESEEIAEFSEVALSDADIQVLESLLRYFEKLGQQNDKDLRIETALAQRRVGDIQQRMGKLEDAESSYIKAWQLYEAVSRNLASQPSQNLHNDLIDQQVSILSALISTQASQGKFLLSMENYRKARKLIESSREYATSEQGRFQLAQLLNNVGRLAARPMLDRPLWNDRSLPAGGGPPRPPGPLGRPAGPGILLGPNSPQIRKEMELNREAITLLRELVSESPTTQGYRVALARALRDETRLLRIRGNMIEADRSIEEAIQIIEEMVQKSPENLGLQYVLSETLLAGNEATMPLAVPATPNLTSEDLNRALRAHQIADQLLSESPLEPNYLSLKAVALIRLSQFTNVLGRAKSISYLDDSVRIYQGLVDRFPDIAIYSAKLVESLMRLSRTEPNKSLEHIDRAIAIVDKQLKSKSKAGFNSLMERLKDRRSKVEAKQN